jgi:ribosomal protein L29
MLNIQEIHGLNDAELMTELQKSQRSLLEMKMGLSQGEMKKVSDIRKYRKYIAQIKTVQTENRKKDKKSNS